MSENSDTQVGDVVQELKEMRRVAVCIGCGDTFVTYSADGQKCIWCAAKEEIDPRQTPQEGSSDA